jgi:hypothetical protein
VEVDPPEYEELFLRPRSGDEATFEAVDGAVGALGLARGLWMGDDRVMIHLYLPRTSAGLARTAHRGSSNREVGGPPGVPLLNPMWIGFHGVSRGRNPDDDFAHAIGRLALSPRAALAGTNRVRSWSRPSAAR